MIFRKLTKYWYTPSIKFPTREISYSGKKIKLTNREALNQAMAEEIEKDSRVFLIG